MNLPRKPILMFAGTRPEIIKLAPIYQRMRESTSLVPTFVHTGQQQEIAEDAFRDFGIVPEIRLSLPERRNEVAQMLAALLRSIGASMEQQQPAGALVQGDTTTTLAGAMSCFYAGMPFGHVEAGLRTGNLRSPFPEEAHRRMVAQIADWHFAPTQANRSSLMNEHIKAKGIHVTGNTVIDAAEHIAHRLPATISISSLLPDDGQTGNSATLTCDERLVLVTAHRRESFDMGIASICQAVARIAEDLTDHRVVFPVHPNPAVRSTVVQILSGAGNVLLVDPVGYRDMIWLVKNAKAIITDSGGIQEEAPTFGTPTLVTRDLTERMEAVEAGVIDLVGTDANRIHAKAIEFANGSEAIRHRNLATGNPYGDGHAADRIVTILESELSA